MSFRARHLLGIEHLAPDEITTLLDLADTYVDLNRGDVKHDTALTGLTQINMFFENSTRTRNSFSLAARRLGADTVEFTSSGSSLSKGETVIDTAKNIEAMNVDAMVVRRELRDDRIIWGLKFDDLPRQIVSKIETYVRRKSLDDLG